MQKFQKLRAIVQPHSGKKIKGAHSDEVMLKAKTPGVCLIKVWFFR